MARHQRLRLSIAGLAAGALLLTGACGNGSEPAAGGTGSEQAGTSGEAAGGGADAALAAMVPDSIKADGKVDVATDASYAPMEFVDAGGAIVGVDPALGEALGKILGVKFVFHNATFDGIIPGLAAGKYELGMSSFTVTEKRKKVVDFVTYFKAGTSVLVPAGNPKNFGVHDMSLCGQRVGAEKGTIQADNDIPSRSKKCEQAGKKAIDEKVFPNQNDVNLALSTGRIDAALADSGVAGYMAKKSNGKFEEVGQAYSTSPYGFAVPKGQTKFEKALQGGINKLIKDGTYEEILKKWSASQGAITESQIDVAKS